MIRRLLAPVIGSALLLGATAGSALAKCEGPNPPEQCKEVVAWFDFGSAGGVIRAGIETPVRVWVSRGEQALDAASVTLVFARASDDVVVRAEGRPSSEAGMWRTVVNLPAGGVWTLTAEVAGVEGVDGAIQRLSLDIVRVREPLAPPEQPVTPVTPAAPIGPATPALPIALLVAGIVAAGLAATALRDRSRRRAPAA